MNKNLKKNDTRNFSNGKLEMQHVNTKTGTVRRVARGAAGFICLAITATMLLSGCGGNIEDFIVDYAGVAKAERRDCVIKHFGSPDQEMQGRLMVYKGRGIIVDTDSRDFLLLTGENISDMGFKDIKVFSGTIVGDIRITESFQKVVELLNKNEQEGTISKLKVYRVSAYSLFQKDNKKFRIIIKSRNDKIKFAKIRLLG